ncbi:MAG: hypothetical protein ACJ764_06845 [Solirubrobacteraceae bacterium]
MRRTNGFGSGESNRGSGALRIRLTALGLTMAVLAVAAGLLVSLTSEAGAASSATPAADCQPFSGTPCLLPYPNNLFTRPDSTSATGRRVRLPQSAMPISSGGKRINVAPYNRNDGFSPGSAMVVHVQGLDNPKAFHRTGAVGVLNMAQAFAPAQPIVVIDEATGKRQLIYSELDSNASTPQDRNLMIVPGRELTDGHTYAVALRNLRNSSGQIIKAPAWFQKLRDGRRLPAGEKSQKTRYAHIFAVLKRAGIGRSNLYEAWDFTVASKRNLTSRLLSIRNNAFGQLGDTHLADNQPQGNAPAFTVTGTSDLTPQIAKITGTFQVPCYLIQCGPKATAPFHYSSTKPDAVPTQISGKMATAPFECLLPKSASPSHPARIALYGHGLLGSHTEVEDSWVTDLITGYKMAFCATDWWGLADGDKTLAVKAVGNLNLFPTLVDRLQQGVLNTLFLARLARSPKGFASNSNFESGHKAVIDTSHVYYYGNSQGGIEGGLTTAVAPDFQRAVLGVTGIDYGNMLIQRSVDFTSFKAVLDHTYPDPSMYPVITDLLQQLWDRGDPDGYAAYMTSHPLPGTPTHTVLMQLAYGDFQVSMYAGAAEARTIGASAVQPALDAARSRDKNLFYAIPTIQHYPFAGSAVEVWDSGPGRVKPPPVGNIPPTESSNNIDPHSDPRKTPDAQAQISEFLEPAGAVQNVCGGTPCHSSDYTP